MLKGHVFEVLLVTILLSCHAHGEVDLNYTSDKTTITVNIVSEESEYEITDTICIGTENGPTNW